MSEEWRDSLDEDDGEFWPEEVADELSADEREIVTLEFALAAKKAALAMKQTARAFDQMSDALRVFGDAAVLSQDVIDDGGAEV